MDNPVLKPLAELAADLRGGDLSAGDLWRAARDAYDASESRLHAYRTWDPEGAAERARAADAAFAAGRDLGPLQGIPVSVKDLYGVRGLPTYAGSPRPLPREWEREGPLVARLTGQHAVITGKTHTVEFAFGALGNNPHWGTPRNPWSPGVHRIPGGSSSGAGVSLWQGTAAVALGSDTGGSVRIPAAMTGCVGLKTSRGRWSTEGIVPLSPSLDTAGVLARSVADAAFAFAALDDEADGVPDPADLSAIRLGIGHDFFWRECTADIVREVRAAVREIVRAGARERPFDLPEAEEAFDLHTKGSLLSAELAAFLSDELPDWQETLDPRVRMRIADGGGLTAEEYLIRRRRLARLAAAASARFDGVDVLVVPTVAIAPPTVESISTKEGFRRAYLGAVRNTCPVNLLDLCAISMPVALDSEGLPVSLQIIAPLGSDPRLIAVARAFEGVLGTPLERLGPPPPG